MSISATGGSPVPEHAPTDYPVAVSFAPPERVARWRPLVHWLLVIPHLFVLWLLSVVAGVMVVLAWFCGVILARIPATLQEPIAMVLRYQQRVSTYQFFLTTDYPPFALEARLDDPGEDPANRFDVVPAIEDRSRLTIFFRYLLAIPHLVALFFVAFAAWAVSFVGFFAVVVLGRWPESMRRFLLGFVRWNLRLSSYCYLLTDRYPPFRLRP